MEVCLVTPRLLAAAALALSLGALAAPAAVAATPDPGNSGSAHACQHGGWQSLRGSDGTTFKNQGQCVSYAARGGTFAAPATVAVGSPAFGHYTAPPCSEPGYVVPIGSGGAYYYPVTGSGFQPGASVTTTTTFTAHGSCPFLDLENTLPTGPPGWQVDANGNFVTDYGRLASCGGAVFTVTATDGTTTATSAPISTPPCPPSSSGSTAG